MIEERIKSYFNQNGWNFNEEKNEDGETEIFISFVEDQKTLLFKIRIISPDRYEIIGKSDIKIPLESMDAALRAVNDLNGRSNSVCAYLTDNGSVIFWIGRFADGGAFSEESFAIEFNMVYKAADIYTDKIFTKVVTQELKNSAEKRNGFLSFFSRNKD